MSLVVVFLFTAKIDAHKATFDDTAPFYSFCLLLINLWVWQVPLCYTRLIVYCGKYAGMSNTTFSGKHFSQNQKNISTYN